MRDLGFRGSGVQSLSPDGRAFRLATDWSVRNRWCAFQANVFQQLLHRFKESLAEGSSARLAPQKAILGIGAFRGLGWFGAP